MSKDIQAELRKAVALLGGARRAERLSKIGRTKITYWMHVAIPEWRYEQAEMIIALARNAKNHAKPVGATPQWALERLKERRKRESVA
jgi:hypothetical protein